MRDSRRRLLLLGLALIAFGWRVVALDRQSLWRDEVDAIFFAVRSLDDTLRMFVQPAQNGPLYFLGLRPWLSIMGTTEFVLRYPSVVAGTLSVPLLWQVARRLLPEKSGQTTTALLGASLMTFNPYQVWYGQEGKMYATITLLALLATWLWWRGVEQGGWRPWLGYWITVSVAMYIHLLMVLIIPLHAIWFVIAWPASRRRWRGYGLALAGLTLPYLPMLWWHWQLLTSTEKLTGFTFTPLASMVQSLILNHARGFTAQPDLVWLAPVFFLAGAGVLLGGTVIGGQWSETAPPLAAGRRYGLLITWLVLPVVFIYLVSLRQPVFTERYVIWIGPAAMLVLALGIRVVARASGRFGPATTIIAVGYVLLLWSYIGWQQKALTIKYDLRDAVAHVYTHRDPNALLILQIPHQEWSYRYYSSNFGPDPFAGSDNRLGRWEGGPYTNWGHPDDQAKAEVDAQMQRVAPAGSDVWVMLSEVEMWDARHLLEGWFNQHGTLVEQSDFPGVQVRHYRVER